MIFFSCEDESNNLIENPVTYKNGVLKGSINNISDSIKASCEYWPSGRLKNYTILKRYSVYYSVKYDPQGKEVDVTGYWGDLGNVSYGDDGKIKVQANFYPKNNVRRVLIIEDANDEFVGSANYFSPSDIEINATIEPEGDPELPFKIIFGHMDTITGQTIQDNVFWNKKNEE